jgi:ubiquitin-protein ligase
MLSILDLMANPNPDDPLDTYKAHIFRQDRKRYDAEAKKLAEERASLSVDQLKVAYNIP